MSLSELQNQMLDIVINVINIWWTKYLRNNQFLWEKNIYLMVFLSVSFGCYRSKYWDGGLKCPARVENYWVCNRPGSPAFVFKLRTRKCTWKKMLISMKMTPQWWRPAVVLWKTQHRKPSIPQAHGDLQSNPCWRETWWPYVYPLNCEVFHSWEVVILKPSRKNCVCITVISCGVSLALGHCSLAWLVGWAYDDELSIKELKYWQMALSACWNVCESLGWLNVWCRQLRIGVP